MPHYKNNCVFCDVARKRIDHFQFWSDEKHVAFLDHNQATFGHTLVIPKDHVSYVFKLHKKEYLALLEAAERIAKVLQKKTGCKRVGLNITGFEVPHTHIHLLPMNRISDVGRKIKKPSRKKMQAFADELKQATKGKVG